MSIRNILGKIKYNIKRDKNINKRIIKKYFNEQEIYKLHIGCGNQILDGWLNSDYRPDSKKILHIDATEKFPFENNQFDYVFSEHMIEHIEFTKGSFMLTECFRILKEGGKIRISTPDLNFLIELYRNSKKDIHKKYIEWNTERFIEYAPYSDASFVFNNYVRDWGHAFIYDENTLRASMEKAGFTEIVRCELNSSRNIMLQDLENDSRMPPGFLALETFTLEGTKIKSQ